MKIMISQPMRGKSTDRIKWERAELIKELEEQGHYVFDTVFENLENNSPLFYLAKSIEYIDKADAVIFMQGWEEARGCRIEEECAKKYGKFIKYEE